MNTLLFLDSIGTPEILVIAIVILLLFGGKKIPELMKGLGKGIRSFKEGMKDIGEDLDDSKGPDSDNKKENPKEKNER